ncbi:melatonin receptor type 1A-like [Paramuricea clavata]|uniref:Melatonin receptor type 1A-like n=1 Tax=Paramuricea clavata TaxID=317549 RepID=A0A6S7H5F6_PARCT|nr:melatonin receptor type 1A-like [Paramuricea clavata]
MEINLLTCIPARRFLYLPSIPTYSETAAEIFCLTIWSGTFCFILGYISIFTCVSLTIERWIAVVKPSAYRSVKPKHAVAAVILAWICGIAVNASTFFRLKYDPDKIICRWTPLPFAAKEAPWIHLTVQSIIPYTTMVVLYAHIYSRMKNLPQISSNRDSQLRKVTVVAVLACSALIIGWLPGRVTFMLSKFGYLHPDGIIHTSCVMITFCNSCVNPALYGMYSPRFRAEYKVVFNKAFKMCASSNSFAVPPANESADVRPLPLVSINGSSAVRSLH